MLRRKRFDPPQMRSSGEMDGSIYLDRLVRHKLFLQEIIDPDSGLLDELLRFRTLTRMQFRHIAEEKPYDNRNAKLLEYITDQGKCNNFVTALRNTKQEHVVNYLMTDGEYRLEFGLNWPLTESRKATIDDNQGALVDLIEMSELQEHLFAKAVINTRQRKAICSEVNDDKKIEMFLEILRRRSQSDFEKTIVCLKESKQYHIAAMLENGGVVIRVHANTDADEENDGENAGRIIRLLGDRSLEEYNLEHTQYNRIEASFLTCINLTQRLEFGRKNQYEPMLKGIGKLGTNICVLCGHPSEIYVFEDRNEFRLMEKMPLQGVKYPRDFGCSERDNCLYVADSGERCVWKIKEESHQRKWRMTMWLETGTDFPPWTLSVSGDGQILIISRKWPNYLRVYGSDAGLRLSIRLPEGVTDIRHAVKATSGTFIILHGLCDDIESLRDSEAGRSKEKKIESNMNTTPDRGREQGRRVKNMEEIDDRPPCRRWALSEWSEDGKRIVRQFIPSYQDEQLKEPRYLTIDSVDRLFIADSGNDRVILLNTDFSWNQTLIRKEVKENRGGRASLPIKRPYRLFYDRQTEQLVVAGTFTCSNNVYVFMTK